MNREEEIRRLRLDPLVADLVLCLRANGVETVESCQGHLAGEGGRLEDHLPYVSFQPPTEEILRVIVHAVECPDYPTHHDWHIVAHMYYSRLHFILQPRWAEERSPQLTAEELEQAQEDFQTFTQSLEYHFRVWREGRFEDHIVEVLGRHLDNLERYV